jgi:hypothetical protein
LIPLSPGGEGGLGGVAPPTHPNQPVVGGSAAQVCCLQTLETSRFDRQKERPDPGVRPWRRFQRKALEAQELDEKLKIYLSYVGLSGSEVIFPSETEEDARSRICSKTTKKVVRCIDMINGDEDLEDDDKALLNDVLKNETILKLRGTSFETAEDFLERLRILTEK